jgi:lysophospholipase L1-like esterase
LAVLASLAKRLMAPLVALMELWSNELLLHLCGIPQKLLHGIPQKLLHLAFHPSPLAR